eukprot:scaffold8956_cov31-Phaeocystis_antarctica.AAC.1
MLTLTLTLNHLVRVDGLRDRVPLAAGIAAEDKREVDVRRAWSGLGSELGLGLVGLGLDVRRSWLWSGSGFRLG